LYQASDVFVLASMYETFSLVGLEAAATGLPLVVTRTSGIAASSLTADDKGGRVVSRDPSAMSAALVELGSDAALRRELGARARARAQRFTWDASAQSTLTLYRSLVADTI
jgi:UDP-glucose:(heptosyl)LPS alpha-1,3-glucosyltransferase